TPVSSATSSFSVAPCPPPARHPSPPSISTRPQSQPPEPRPRQLYPRQTNPKPRYLSTSLATAFAFIRVHSPLDRPESPPPPADPAGDSDLVQRARCHHGGVQRDSDTLKVRCIDSSPCFSFRAP